MGRTPTYLENGNRSYNKVEHKCAIQRNEIKFVKDEANPEGAKIRKDIPKELVLIIIPEKIEYVLNKETEQTFTRFTYKDRSGVTRSEDFDDFDKILEFIKTRGYMIGTGSYWKEYIGLLNGYAGYKEFYPEGISYKRGKYKYIDSNEETISNPEYDQIKIMRAKKQLRHHELISNIRNKKHFRGIMKWGLVSKFFFAVKSDGVRRDDDMIPYLFLTGQSKAAKTAILKIIGQIYESPVKASGSIKTDFTLMKTLSMDKDVLLVEEAYSLFANKYDKKYIETLKANASSTMEIGARGTKTQGMNHYIGQRTVGFSMNDDPEISDTGMRRRMIDISFNIGDMVTEESKEAYTQLKKSAYISNLRELFFYLHMKIIDELNSTEDSFIECVDRVLTEEGLEEYKDVTWIVDADIATEREELFIFEEIYSFINEKLASNNNYNNGYLLKQGFIPGVKEKNNEYYATSTFVDWYNNKSRRFKISLKRLAKVLDFDVNINEEDENYKSTYFVNEDGSTNILKAVKLNRDEISGLDE